VLLYSGAGLLLMKAASGVLLGRGGSLGGGVHSSGYGWQTGWHMEKPVQHPSQLAFTIHVQLRLQQQRKLQIKQ